MCMCAHVVLVWVCLCMEMDTTCMPVPKEARGSHIIGVQVDLENGFAVVERLSDSHFCSNHLRKRK